MPDKISDNSRLQGQNLTQEEIDKLVEKLLKEKTATAKGADATAEDADKSA